MTPETPATANARPEFLIWCAAVCALVLKLYCAWTTIGTTDVFLHNLYGKRLAEHGLTAMYQATATTAMFNHTPLIAGYFAGTYKSAVFLGSKFPFLARYFPPREPFLFPFLLRLPPILADLLAVWVVIRLRRKLGEPPVWAVCLFALSPVSFMVSGYHGNFDSMMVLFLLLAAWMCVEERPLLCALFLGLGCNIKIISLLFGPVFFFHWLYRKQAWPFAFCTGAVCLAGWSPALIGCPGLFIHNVLGYGSYWGVWGITSWLHATHWPAFDRVSFTGLSGAQKLTMDILKYTIILGVLGLAWRRRALSGRALLSTIAYAWAVFFILAPGACAQYMVWPAPFILLCSVEWYVAVTATTSLFLFQFYDSISVSADGKFGMPWLYGISLNRLDYLWVPWTNLPWLALFLGLLALALKGRSRAAAIAPPDSVPLPAT